MANCSKVSRKTTSNKAYWNKRLIRERPDLHERVRRRELSAFAATVEAGWRKRPEPQPPHQARSEDEQRPRWVFIIRRGNINPEGKDCRPPILGRVPILGWGIEGHPLVYPGHNAVNSPEVNWAEEDMLLSPLLPQSDGIGYYCNYPPNNLVYPIESDLEDIAEDLDNIGGEIGWRLRRKMGCDGHNRMLLDEAQAQALYAQYLRNWENAAPARERIIAECQAAAERLRQEQEQKQWQKETYDPGSANRFRPTAGDDPLQEAATILALT